MSNNKKAIFYAILAAALYAINILLSFEDMSSLEFSWESLFVLLACVCWGFENNCTRMLSSKNPTQIVIIKGFGSGLGSLILSFIIGERYFHIGCLVLALLLGFVAYGLSIYFYIYAQRDLGAAKTSTYYAVSPFIGTGLSLLIFREIPSVIVIIQYPHNYDAKIHLKLLRNGIFALLNHILTVSAASASTCSE